MTLDEFFDELDQHTECVPIDELTRLMGKLSITRNDLNEYIKFNDDHYARNMVRLGPGYAALILCWQPGQASPIHDHSGSACGVRVIDGVLSETKYSRASDGTLSKSETNVYPPTYVCGSFDADIHVIRNDEPTGRGLITMHVYTPPLEQYHVYAPDTGKAQLCRDEETMAERKRLAGAAR
jgi:cysteine dioxygenase